MAQFNAINPNLKISIDFYIYKLIDFSIDVFMNFVTVLLKSKGLHSQINTLAFEWLLYGKYCMIMVSVYDKTNLMTFLFCYLR